MLIVALDASRKEPLYEQIYNSIKEEIVTGALPFGARLPSARRLAKHLDVSRNTVDTAYAQLCAEGYIESKPKRGFFVCQVEELAELHIPVKIEDEEEEIKKEEVPYDFSPVGVDMTQFPYHIWRKLLKEIMINDNSELFQKGNFQGDLELRKAIMYYLRQSRGVHVHTSQIVVAAGMENLLFLIHQILGEKVSIGIENPVYKNAYAILKELNFKIHPITMDESGMCVEQLEQTDANLAYVTPAHQYPTGVIMPVGRRSQLLRWAKKDPDRYIIEDDYDSEFRYKGKPIPALQGMDQNGCVIYMGTFSKAIAPAIRVGYMVLPEALLSVYLAKGRFYSSTVSRVDQRILAKFISGGYFERHLNRMREIYKGKHDALLGELKPLEKRFEITGEFAGLHVLLKDRKKEPEQQLLEKAAEKKVRVYGLSGFYMERAQAKEMSTIVLGYAGLTEEEIRKGVDLLRKALE